MIQCEPIVPFLAPVVEVHLVSARQFTTATGNTGEQKWCEKRDCGYVRILSKYGNECEINAHVRLVPSSFFATNRNKRVCWLPSDVKQAPFGDTCTSRTGVPGRRSLTQVFVFKLIT